MRKLNLRRCEETCPSYGWDMAGLGLEPGSLGSRLCSLPCHPAPALKRVAGPLILAPGLPPVPVVEGGRGEDHGELVDPLSGVAPATPGLIPEVAPRQEAHQPLREALPHHKSKVHLGRHVSEVRGRNIQKYGRKASLDSGRGDKSMKVFRGCLGEIFQLGADKKAFSKESVESFY